jgi:hypothetical protein
MTFKRALDYLNPLNPLTKNMEVIHVSKRGSIKGAVDI